ncbi:probable RNA-binding protein 18 isoform X2 [Homalodisca vitripennis]|uniref:probable RNA-binding protein 18 isoform X2 n=1 Tax=Homalodisca vitripennis TaxID=197043 RepID=UPI001EEC3139|nr:probable RNA-binding protein 18 isoform X2 [Homalodisca vitripennis]
MVVVLSAHRTMHSARPLTKVTAAPEPPPLEQKSDDRRLWIGNLDTCVSEYQLLKILEKHGRMEKFDLLFHRSGPLAGQPRGYAFVTYATVEQAEMMRAAMDGKKIGSKHIAVRWAHKLTLEDREKPKVELEIPALSGAKSKIKISRLTKIQQIEAKLRMMEESSNEFQPKDGPSGVGNSHPVRAFREKSTKPYKRPSQRR